jgi:uncharacterized protein (TIGR02145 family)
MTENLQVARFRNGDSIPHAKTSSEWLAAGDSGKPAWCYFNNDPSTEKTYGKLYNWFAVNDRRGLAPEGWHVPSSNEVDQLIQYIQLKHAQAASRRSGKPLKVKKGTRPPVKLSIQTGHRKYDGNFIEATCDSQDCYGKWWTATESVNYLAGIINLLERQGGLYSLNTDLSTGLFVRCIKN